MKVQAEISVGELVDKVTILETKQERVESASALENIEKELSCLNARLSPILKSNAPLNPLKLELKGVNESLWDIENEIRSKEAKKEFDTKFIELARSVYQTNDHRSSIKREINDLLGSEIVEEKSYSSY